MNNKVNRTNRELANPTFVQFVKHNLNFKMLLLIGRSTKYGRPLKNLPSLHGRKLNPNLNFLGTPEHIWQPHILSARSALNFKSL